MFKEGGAHRNMFGIGPRRGAMPRVRERDADRVTPSIGHSPRAIRLGTDPWPSRPRWSCRHPGPGELQLYRLSERVSFHCVRCQKDKSGFSYATLINPCLVHNFAHRNERGWES
jgi:hypothetical protein